MSYKTDKLVKLFPEAYAADDSESMLYKLLDALGAELMVADEGIKALLKSHWVDYAEGGALDGLGAIYGVSRRMMRSGALEGDEAFRLRLKNTVPLFTGGGTIKAILGATRSALGLPFDIDQLNLTPRFTETFTPQIQSRLLRNIRDALDALVTLEEFSPTGVRIRSALNDVKEVDNTYQLNVVVQVATADIAEVRPTIRWRFEESGSYMLSLVRVDAQDKKAGFKMLNVIPIKAGQTLQLMSIESGPRAGYLSALLDGVDISNQFVARDGRSPARLPDVPPDRSEWLFSNHAGRFDSALFDKDTFNPGSKFTVEMLWLRYTPLTFTVMLPYFLREAVEKIRQDNHYAGDLFLHEGLPIEAIPEVVNQTRVAGVNGIVQFYLNFYEDHEVKETFASMGTYRFPEEAGANESFLVGNVNRIPEAQEMRDRFLIGGVFDVSTFDTNYTFTKT
jgi:hypothetical protein